jgi:hypothetical protein
MGVSNEEHIMTATSKTVRLTITAADLIEAQGGVDPICDQTRIWVEIPADYDPEAITAADVIDDPAITVVEER